MSERYVDGPLSRGPIPLDQWDAEVAAMLKAAAEKVATGELASVASPEVMREWAAEAADDDRRGVPREPMPHEDYCPGLTDRFCDRQKGHTGECSRKY